MKRFLHGLSHAIFWIWNLAFLLVVYLGILPIIGPALVAATFAGEIPLDFSLTLAGLVAVPTLSTAVAVWRFKNRPIQLMRLFYGVEAPLFLLCLIRLFLIRELTPASTQIIGTLLICIAAFAVDLVHSTIARSRPAAWLQMAAHSLMLLMGLYVGAVLMFYALPLAGFLLAAFLRFGWVGALWNLITSEIWSVVWWLPIFALLFGFSATLFVAMPSALAALYVLSGRQKLQDFAAHYGRRQTWIGAGAALTAWLVIFVALQQQPQVQAFELLDRPIVTEDSRQALLAQSNEIRKGLLNAYLSPYRYLSTRQENNHIEQMHRSVFGLSQPAAAMIQATYNQLMSPLLYDGARSDSEKAAKLYAEFFDTPIQKSEQQAVQRALQSTFNREEAKAGVLNINQRKVWLQEQQVTVTEHGDWADVELYEEYQNQTNEEQEVFYSFYLPENAALTGVWLGDTADRTKRFVFTVSPRGAAQQVYNQEVQRRVDPALLEQVGPRHYRLRAFPIPRQLPRGMEVAADTPKSLHLWMTYKVMQQADGWPLPQLAEKRNIFWTKNTQRIRNGQEVNFPRNSDLWLEAAVPASHTYQPAPHQVSLSGYQISAKPLSSKDYVLPQNQRFAVVLDTSRSMATHQKELIETFQWFKNQGFADNQLVNNDADLYLTAASGAQPQRIDDLRRFDPAKMTAYGTIQLKEMLQQFQQLRNNTTYDGILLLTDEGSYELSDDDKTLPAIAAPVWMVHLGGKLPPAYDDATLKVVQDSRGGVATTIPEVMQRLATQTKLGPSVISVVDGYAWSWEKNPPAESVGSQPTPAALKTGFEPLAARQLVLELSKSTSLNQPTELDGIHAIAKTFDIVTPYSSMIVLVNDEQREALKRAEAASDRFDREVESGTEQLTQPHDPLTVSGVPEPEEWLLITVAGGALLLIRQRRRRTLR